MSKGKRIESAGWGVFLVLWAILSIPIMWYIWSITVKDTAAIVRLGLGFLSSMLAAGIVTWIVNSALHSASQRRMKQEAAERKKSKNKKK